MVLKILTPDLDGSNLENQNKMNEELYERTKNIDLIQQDNFKEDIRAYSNIVNNFVEAKDLFNKPPKGVSYDSFAESINDPYYKGITASNETSQGKSIVVKQGDYFFYSVKTDDFKESAFSFFAQIPQKVEGAKINYRLLDEETPKPYLKSIEIFNDKYNVYGVLNQSLTIGQTLELRFDNRNGSGDLVINNPVLFEGGKVQHINPEIGGLEYDINNLKETVQTLSDSISEDSTSDSSSGLYVKGFDAPVYTPQDFSIKEYPLKGLIYTDGHGKFLAKYNVSQNKLDSSKTYYVDYANGSDNNSGLAKGTALKSFSKAFEYINTNDTIVACEGYHFRSGGGVIPKNFNKSLNIIGENDNVHLIMGDEPVWTKTEGASSVYQTSRSAVDKTVNLKNNKALTKVSSIEEVDGLVDSWCTLDGIVYVNTGGEPDINTAPLLGANHIQSSPLESDIYLENLKVYGGRNGIELNLNADNNAYLKNVKTYHSQENYNGIATTGGNHIILQECEGSFNSYDGLNYHAGSDGSIPLVIEIDCKGIENGSDKGQDGVKSNNGSTTHDGISVIRINGVYARNDGGNVADVNEGTQSWNLGTVAYESYQGKDFQTSSGSDMWLDNCVAYGSENSINSSDTNSTVYTRFGKYQNKLILGEEIQY